MGPLLLEPVVCVVVQSVEHLVVSRAALALVIVLEVLAVVSLAVLEGAWVFMATRVLGFEALALVWTGLSLVWGALGVALLVWEGRDVR